MVELQNQGYSGGTVRIDDIQCAHGRCWTWAHFTPPGAQREQLLSVDWLPSGEVSVGFVVE